MSGHILTFRATRCSLAGVGLLLLAVMPIVGCQGFSSSKAAVSGTGTTTGTGTGTGPADGSLSLNPATVSFGSVQVGSNEPMSETVTNTGGSSVTISQVVTSGTGFALAGLTAPITLAAGQAANFSVTFTPQSAGSASGSVTITSNGSNPSLVLSLAGSGTTVPAQLSATPSSLAIGSVFVGATGTASGSLNASGANVTVTSVTSSNSEFTISGLSLPAVITAGQDSPFTVTFSPNVAGAASATLTFISNAQTSTITTAAAGTGMAAPAHSVSLSWSPSSSPGISGYNIYRAVYVNSCGPYSKINGSTLDPNTTYSDITVADGTNYCYATTAVNSSNEESGYSNIVSDVQIPAP
jgi:Abnormal spindle-like microcephaly-assoc'd, ASPM-SPD-2-Hydin